MATDRLNMNYIIITRTSKGYLERDEQINIINKALKANSSLWVDEIDLSKTGLNFKSLLHTMNKNRAQLIIVPRLDTLLTELKTFEELVSFISFIVENNFDISFVDEKISTLKVSKHFLVRLYSAWISSKSSRKKEIAAASRKKAKEKGSRIGRPKTRDDKTILDLRRQGHSYREIANLLRVSVASVQRALKQSQPDHSPD